MFRGPSLVRQWERHPPDLLGRGHEHTSELDQGCNQAPVVNDGIALGPWYKTTNISGYIQEVSSSGSLRLLLGTR